MALYNLIEWYLEKKSERYSALFLCLFLQFLKHEMSKNASRLNIETLEAQNRLCIEYQELETRDTALRLSTSPRTPKTQFTFVDICAGCGGMAAGFANAGMIPLLLNDCNKYATETLKVNFPGVTITTEKIENMDVKVLPKADVYIACLPCQPHSRANPQKKGMEDPNNGCHLWECFLNMVKAKEPHCIVMENVEGASHSAKFHEYIRDLTNLGYVVSTKLIRCEKYGVPQTRVRLFLVALQSISFVFPEPTEAKKTLGEALREVKSIGLIAGPYKTLPQKRLREDFPCPTLTTSLCSSTGFTTYCHPTEDRPLSVNEAAAIQTFKPEYVFVGSVTSQYKQIGNAVPPLIATIVGKSVIEQLLKLRK